MDMIELPKFTKEGTKFFIKREVPRQRLEAILTKRKSVQDKIGKGTRKRLDSIVKKLEAALADS